ncbi:MAG: VOC family protein [Gluconacetobacter diazotrophicus]|nr:VOC family protein [Gluconacetobacter diazotrophicus]
MPDHVGFAECAAPASSLSVGRITLTVRDRDRVAEFYQRVVGLHAMPSGGGPMRLGAGNDVLLELRHDPAARPASPREAGLFHTAFLLPGRSALAAWLRYAAVSGQPLSGASDHAVSEAVYLSDPEGNGVEMYADRPAAEWRWSGGLVHMPSEPLDLQGLMALDGGGRWDGLLAATVGHVHLRVGDIPEAERFYAALPGLAVTARHPGGTFYAAGGYHHHLATNVWHSRGALPRDGAATGLAAVELRLPADELAAARSRLPGAVPNGAGGLLLRDPWNTAVVLTPTHLSKETDHG